MSAKPGDAEFKSQLDENSKKIAKEELNELNDKDREMAVQTFRQWVLQQKWLRTPTDFGFLLRFLRAKKFSQLLARKTLENYWTMKTKCPDWFKDLDPADPVLQEILSTGFFISPKAYDRHGRRVIIDRFGLIDVTKAKKDWGVSNLFRAVVLVFEWMKTDENIQVNGLCRFSDIGDFSMSHFTTFLNLENIRRFIGYYQQALPIRIKRMDIYRESAAFDTVFAVIQPMLSQKLKDRITLHGRSLVNVYKVFDMQMLPDEYLPDDYDGPRVGAIQQITEKMIADMNKPEFRNYILNLSSGQYGVDLGAKGNDVPDASFRKLNVE